MSAKERRCGISGSTMPVKREVRVTDWVNIRGDDDEIEKKNFDEDGHLMSMPRFTNCDLEDFEQLHDVLRGRVVIDVGNGAMASGLNLGSSDIRDEPPLYSHRNALYSKLSGGSLLASGKAMKDQCSHVDLVYSCTNGKKRVDYHGYIIGLCTTMGETVFA